MLLIYDDSACVLCDYADVYFIFYVIILMNVVNIQKKKYAKSYDYVSLTVLLNIVCT